MSRPDPTIPYDHFRHAQIEAVDWPHADRLILTLTPLTWTGLQSTRNTPVQLHFYDIQESHTIASFFTALVGEEVALIRLDPNTNSTYRTLSTLIVLERLQQEITVQAGILSFCQNRNPYQQSLMV